eukprot:TRINITY_DN29188_c0_g1_i1.p1 TRINITY_DN29188_c0_g1~~TRINITY_DN29188_c0_g1_i1.p1  ORF type:complete len:444 (+),score=122.49 TRINITY_DN29188_c0_g1_i1:89-1420(+)
MVERGRHIRCDGRADAKRRLLATLTVIAGIAAVTPSSLRSAFVGGWLRPQQQSALGETHARAAQPGYFGLQGGLQASSRLARPAAETLYDMPVSNNGARARLIIYAKGLDKTGAVEIQAPSALGGLKGEDYLALNPQGKMPLMKLADGSAVYESDTIARYLTDKFADVEPSFLPATPESRALDNLIARLHDVYVVALQACMYKAAPPFGIFGSRWEALAELRKQVRIINDLASSDGPFLTGSAIGQSDAALLPTMVFMQFMLPKYMQEGWEWSEEEAFGPKLVKWWRHMTSDSVPAGKRVYEEIQGALNAWNEKGRWDTILHAGRRDTAEATIFDKVISKEIPSEIVFEDDRCVVFKDINPAAPVHLLVIPKRREGLTQLRNAVADHDYILGHLLRVASEQGKKAVGEGGYRVVINDGADAGQTVFHLHVHVIGGRALTWPPG